MPKRSYIRDKRSPTPLNETVSYTMSQIGGKNTKPELMLRKALYAEGIRGYRIHWKKAAGKPDLAWVGKKKAVFINGCYWHRCPLCSLKLPKTNTAFWEAKFDKNIARDKKNINLLNKAGWAVLTLWECEIKRDLDNCMHRLRIFVYRS